MGRRCELEIAADGRSALEGLAHSSVRSEADRARAVLWSLDGETAVVIGRRLGVRADTVRTWRVWYSRRGVDGLRRRSHSGRPGTRGAAALACATEILAELSGSTVWTLPRLAGEITRRIGVTVSIGRLSVLLRKKGALPGAAPAGLSKAATIASVSITTRSTVISYTTSHSRSSL